MEAIVIYIGIPEVQHDDKTTCDQLVRNFFIETMSVKKEDVDAMRCVRVHRIGKPLTQVQSKNTPPPRSIIVRFNDYSDRQKVWECRKNLGHTKYSVNENFPQSVEYNRRKLYPIYKLAKKSEALQEKVTLKNDVLTSITRNLQLTISISCLINCTPRNYVIKQMPIPMHLVVCIVNTVVSVIGK